MEYIRKGKGPVLVFQHGFMSGASYWRKQIDHFSGTHDVIATNLPGYAENRDDPVDKIEGFVEFLLSLMDKLKVSEFSLVGHSMGGMIAQEFAIQHPDRLDKLVLYATGPDGSMPGRFESISASRDRILLEGREQTLRNTVSSWFLNEEADANFQKGMALAESTPLDTMMAGYTAMENWQSVDRLKQIKNDTLILWGDGDRSYRWPHPAALWNRVESANLSVVASCAHNVHLEKPSLFNAILGDFLKSK